MSWLLPIVLVLAALLPQQLVSDNLAARLAGGDISSQLPSDYQSVPIPVKSSARPLQIGAASAYAVDLASGQTLLSSHADTQRPIASTTKLATALVIVREHKDNDMITIPKLPTYAPDDETIGLKEGERFSVHDLLAALLINSANDAADAFAIQDSGSREAFAAKMNRLMAEWGVADAHFSNPSGLVDEGNGASARALANIASLAIRNQTIRELVATPNAAITDSEGRTINLTATDKLLQNGEFQGIKTGYTPAAGECFVGLTSVQGHQIITVVLGSHDRFGDTRQLTDWIQANYQWQ